MSEYKQQSNSRYSCNVVMNLTSQLINCLLEWQRCPHKTKFARLEFHTCHFRDKLDSFAVFGSLILPLLAEILDQLRQFNKDTFLLFYVLSRLWNPLHTQKRGEKSYNRTAGFLE